MNDLDRAVEGVENAVSAGATKVNYRQRTIHIVDDEKGWTYRYNQTESRNLDEILAAIDAASQPRGDSRYAELHRENPRHDEVERGLVYLAMARGCFQRASAHRVVVRIRAAISSAKGARRNTSHIPIRQLEKEQREDS